MKAGKITDRAFKRIISAVRRIDALAPKPNTRYAVKRNPPQQVFAVLCTIDGGSAGSASATCSYTYTVTLHSGYVLGEHLTPARRRFANTPYTETPAESWGCGFFDKDGEFVLLDANELPQTEEC